MLWLPTEYPPLNVAPPGIKYPNARISEFLMDGSFKITISKPLSFSDGLAGEHTRIKSTELTHED